MASAVTTSVDLDAKLMTSVFSTFDDPTLLEFAREIVTHPDYNNVDTRVLDLRGVEKPDVSFETAREAFALVGKHSKAKVMVVTLVSQEFVEGFKRLYEVHADTAPFELLITSSEQDIQLRRFDSVEEREEVVSRAERTVARMRKAMGTHTVIPSVFKDVERFVDEVDPEIGKVFKEIRRSYSDGSTFAATAGCHELLRRIAEIEDDSIYDGVNKLVESGELFGYFTPILRLHASALRRDAIGEEQYATTLIRLCTVLLIYKLVLPQWVETYLYDLPIEKGEAEE